MSARAASTTSTLPENYQFLGFHIKILKILQIWPQVAPFRKYLLFLALLPTSATVGADCFLSFGEPGIELSEIIQTLIAEVCIIGVHYMIVCFVLNGDRIQTIVDKIRAFDRHAPLTELIEVDKRSQFFARLLMFYTTIAPIIYIIIPILPISLNECERSKSPNRVAHGIPCGLVARARLPIKFNFTPLQEMMYLHQAFLSFTISWIIMIMTLLLAAILNQVTYHFRRIKMLLLDLEHLPTDKIAKQVNDIIVYHIEIIQYCDEINEAFGSQNVLHVSLTSFVISILGFELLVLEFIGRVRFTLNLIGWIFMLLLVCHFGQVLMDESVAIVHAAYNTKWYEMPVDIQKQFIMIIMRAQKPIKLNAINLGFMSFPTFLKVMKTAYSYFTLLINIM